MSRWHIVKDDDYPTPGLPVLCWAVRGREEYSDGGTVLVGQYAPRIGWSFAETSGEEVTHWMWLPAAPKG